MDLDDGATELAARAVDEAVERRYARELAVGERQGKEIALAELQRRIETTCRRHHRCRRVDAERIDAVGRQIARDLSASAPETAHASTMFHGAGEAIKHIPVERLAVELREVLLGVLLRDRVVARHDGVAPAGWRRCHPRAANAVRGRSSPSASSASGAPRFSRARGLTSGLRKIAQ